MCDRAAVITDFLQTAGWGDATRAPLAGDAGLRRYERLTLEGDTRVLMDAPPSKGEDVHPFVAITQYLRGIGLSAPAIHAEDTHNGLLLIEDLGDALFARVIADNPHNEPKLYAAAVDVLVALHAKAPPALARYDTAIMTQMAGLAFDWYQRGVVGGVDTSEKDAVLRPLSAKLNTLDAVTPVLIQRDYHAENLIWLPERSGVQRVGLLDYQDAMLGHPAYDLVSILKDARRDVPAALEAEMIDRYLAQTPLEVAAFRDAYALLGLQRNLRILGVFARLSMVYAKPHYVDLIPRVWGHIQSDLISPILADIAAPLRAALPSPTPDNLQRLKDQCGTHPLP